VAFVWLLLFCPVEKLAELADGPPGCGAVARGGCSFAWNYQCDVLTEAEGKVRPNMALSLH